MVKTIGISGQEFGFDGKFEEGTIEEIYRLSKERGIVGVDTETEGINFLEDKILMLQLGWEDVQFVVDIRYVDISKFKDLLEDESILKILQNVKFDYKFLKTYGICLQNIHDTMLANNILTCGIDEEKSSLEVLVRDNFNVQLNKEERNKFVGLGGKPFTHKQIMYGAEDTKYLIPLYNIQRRRLEDLNLSYLMNIENNAVFAFAEMEYNGILLDTEAWDKVSKDSLEKLILQRNKLDSIIYKYPELNMFIKKHVQADLFIDFENLRKVSVNWDSPTQVLKVIKALFPDIEDTNANTLIKYKHELVKELLIYKEIAKEVSTYGSSFKRYIWKDGRVRTSFYQILATGRVSSGDKNGNSPNIMLGAIFLIL